MSYSKYDVPKQDTENKYLNFKKFYWSSIHAWLFDWHYHQSSIRFTKTVYFRETVYFF